MRHGQGARVSARAVDAAAAGAPCARERTGRGTRMSGQLGPGHGVQDSWPRGNQAAQGTVLSGTARRRVRAEDGRSSVRLPQVQVLKRAKSKKADKSVAI